MSNEFRRNIKDSTVLKSLRLDGDSENPQFKPQDIGNAAKEYKAKQLDELTLTQTLLKKLSNTND